MAFEETVTGPGPGPGPVVPEAQLESHGNLARLCTVNEIDFVVAKPQAHETAPELASEEVYEHGSCEQDKRFAVEEATSLSKLASTLTIRASGVWSECTC